MAIFKLPLLAMYRICSVTSMDSQPVSCIHSVFYMVHVFTLILPDLLWLAD